MFCQKCRTPLTLDSSLDNLGPSAFNLLIDSATKRSKPDNTKSRSLYTEQQKELYDRVSASTGSPTFKSRARHGGNDHANGQGPNNPAMSYVLLTESQVTPPPSSAKLQLPTEQSSPRSRRSNNSLNSTSSDNSNLLSHKVETTNRLFSILTSHSDIDHPICTECTALLTSGLEKRLAFATKERDAYLNFLRDASADVPTEEERHAARDTLSRLRLEEATAMTELEALEAEHVKLQEELAELALESAELDKEEADFFRARNAFAAEVESFRSERESLQLRYEHDATQLARLSRTNVYNDAFLIGHDGYYGTINDLRLGRSTKGAAVEWAEVNAAWGQTCLLIAVIAEKIGFEFQGYRLKPCGSVSAVEKMDSRKVGGTEITTNKVLTTLPLCHTNEMPLSFLFWKNDFDEGMQAFLDCVRQLGKHVERTTTEEAAAAAKNQADPSKRRSGGLKLPYGISKDMIYDCSIKLANGEEQWTKACKYLLTCCKMLLAHASNVSIRNGSDERG